MKNYTNGNLKVSHDISTEDNGGSLLRYSAYSCLSHDKLSVNFTVTITRNKSDKSRPMIHLTVGQKVVSHSISRVDAVKYFKALKTLRKRFTPNHPELF